MGFIRNAAILSLALLAFAALLRWVVGAGRRKGEAPGPGPMRPGTRHSAELRCEAHGLTVRLEADGAEEFERSRLHLRCPLCAAKN